MLDPSTPKGRILTAALECAAKASWADVTLLDIAEAAKLPLADLRGQFSSKSDIVAGLLRAIDDELLKRVAKPTQGQEKRDALFDVIMTRFDILAPYKAALQSIRAAGGADLALAPRLLASQHWMLEAAGIGTDGAAGAVRVAGLALAYASVFDVWLKDDDPGLAKTMAALDRRLRRGERAIGALHEAGRTASRVGETLRNMARAAREGRKSAKPETPATPEPGAPAV